MSRSLLCQLPQLPSTTVPPYSFRLPQFLPRSHSLMLGEISVLSKLFCKLSHFIADPAVHREQPFSGFHLGSSLSNSPEQQRNRSPCLPNRIQFPSEGESQGIKCPKAFNIEIQFFHVKSGNEQIRA